MSGHESRRAYHCQRLLQEIDYAELRYECEHNEEKYPDHSIVEKHRTATRQPDKKPAAAHDVMTSEGAGSSLLTDNRAELPRCPACRTAISFYDVK